VLQNERQADADTETETDEIEVSETAIAIAAHYIANYFDADENNNALRLMVKEMLSDVLEA
jgi:hypothetical protein